ncbi:endonuclease/exonuclease/phosphatase family protein [Photobacterium sp. TY1-4]|uniref:endonuclease/exonuclease/phosphatase family protein n=1 Tax=Photobacterium sp. TY1-4 TaxID=2899122 RepID=UPI0021C0D8B2|nr:endonuclease/exonuclease/phosphatase family protein [Photobacterium sp. TY1-4]UXI02881.1 endonuclease/exonuclease/phosphatase family protein [Photobacterium sp. TY1-4]
MSAPAPGEILAQTAVCDDPRLSRLAAIIQHTRPDLLMLCEFDHPGTGGDDGSLANFCRHYLERSQHQQSPITYPYRYCPPTNTGLLSPHDLDGDGALTLPGDGLGFGEHHGHFGFVVLSRYPILESQIRNWQQFRWQDMPDNQIPADFYSPQAQQVLRLSSKNHVLVPVQIDGQQLNLLCCHPTPPVFDGAEQRNARRNFDELRLLTEIIDDAPWLHDDQGRFGGLGPEDPFVVLGDLNADMADGDGIKVGIRRLLLHPKINRQVSAGKHTPKSLGGRFHLPWQPRQGRATEWTHLAGLRLDYVLPSADLPVLQSGVFWPDKKDPLRPLICDEQGRPRAQAGSDHRLVWVDIMLAPDATRQHEHASVKSRTARAADPDVMAKR